MRIAIFGAGGHAKVVCEVIEAVGGHTLVGFIAPAPDSQEFLGYDLIDEDTFLRGAPGVDAVAVAIGDNRRRSIVATRVRAALPGVAFPALTHPSAQVSRRAALAEGAVVMPRAVVSAGATVGRLAVVNTGAVVEHDAHLGDSAHLAPGAILGGGSSVGQGCLIGIGAAVRPGVRIADGCVLGMGTVAVSDLEEGVFVGVPAARLARAGTAAPPAPHRRTR